MECFKGEAANGRGCELVMCWKSMGRSTTTSTWNMDAQTHVMVESKDVFWTENMILQMFFELHGAV